MHGVRNCVGLNRDEFTKYVICRKCHSIYIWKETQGSLTISEQCSFVEFPRHPQVRYHKPCGTRLMKSIKLPSGKLSYYPFKVYCFKPLITSIQELCNRLNFIEVCNHWRNRNVCNGIISNVYDGQLWKKFERFTTDTNNCASCSLSLVLNIDWFQLGL